MNRKDKRTAFIWNRNILFMSLLYLFINLMCPGWIEYNFLPQTNLTQVYTKLLNGSVCIQIVYYKYKKRKREVIKHKDIFCIQNPAQNATGHGPHQSECPQRLSAYRNRIIAKSKGAQHFIPPSKRAHTQTYARLLHGPSFQGLHFKHMKGCSAGIQARKNDGGKKERI